MRSRTGLFVSFVAILVFTVSGVGFVVFQQSQNAEPSVKQENQRYEAEKEAAKKPVQQPVETTQPALTEQKPVEAQPEPVAETTINIYFSKNPESDSPAMVFPVERKVYQGQDSATTAVQEIIAGPTADEKANGYFGGIELQGKSTCDNKDFTLVIADSTATLKFCRVYSSEGMSDDARLRAQLSTTIKQITGVTQVNFQDTKGNCLFQLRNRCVQ